MNVLFLLSYKINLDLIWNANKNSIRTDQSLYIHWTCRSESGRSKPISLSINNSHVEAWNWRDKTWIWFEEQSKSALCGDKKNQMLLFETANSICSVGSSICFGISIYFSHVHVSFCLSDFSHTLRCAWCWHWWNVFRMRSINVQMAHRTVVGFWHMNELDLMANIYRWQFHFGFCAWMLVLYSIDYCVHVLASGVSR